MTSQESAEPKPTLSFETKSTETSPTPKEPEEPTPANPPLRKFSLFTHLPSEIRTDIWTTAILRELGAGPPASEPLPFERLHVIPFYRLPTEEPFTSVSAYLEARYGADWANTATDAERPALVAEAEEAVRKHARSRTVLMPPGRAPGTGAQFSAGLCGSGVADSCVEATAVADALGRLASGGGDTGGDDGDGAAAVAGQETLVGLGRGDVCCFVNVRADGSPIGWRDMPQFWKDEDAPSSRESCGLRPSEGHLGLFPGGEEWVGAVREGWGCDDEMLAGVTGLGGLLPALTQCEVLAGVWHPAMCRYFETKGFNDDIEITNIPPHPELCAEFKRDLESLPVRYPELKTICIIDPMLRPKANGLHALHDDLKKYRLRFRGCRAAFYPGYSSYFMQDTHRIGSWQLTVEDLLRNVTKSLGRGYIAVVPFACVPDDCEQDPWGTNHE